MNSLSSHVLDTAIGRPAGGMKITLTDLQGNTVQSITDQDGRCNQWQDTVFSAGTYSLRFHTGEYLSQHHGDAFYPHVDVHFVISDEGGHYHIPLLISPYGYSSYRGS